MGILVALSATWLTGCSSTRPSPRMPDPAPPAIQVNGEAMSAINFDKVLVDIPDHRLIGYHHEGMEYVREYQYWWGPEFSSETDLLNGNGRAILREAGYRMAGEEPGVLRLVGTMRKFNLNTYAYGQHFQQAECEMRWEMYRTGEKRPFWTSSTDGVGRIDGDGQGVIAAAFELALRELMADEEFVAAVGGR